MEKIYKVMRNAGAASTGVLSIVEGAILLKRKEDLTF